MEKKVRKPSYLDFTSLYSSCMVESLPYGAIRLLNEVEQEEFPRNKLMSHDCENERVNYILLIDSKPPSKEVVDATDDLPLGMTLKLIAEEDLSPYCQKVLEVERGGGNVIQICQNMLEVKGGSVIQIKQNVGGNSFSKEKLFNLLELASAIYKTWN
ncbi:hypothetical protein SK128_002714, partial [Halocaridina rubra]